ncbi:hypothetical protein RHGRI_020954 [Rhododendron griersonianum]|uniref:Uncharacterized protein n=1 Tax=Rhododendron griersonianum TaxID=479676 RepID=A0AAV6JM69_9ERIC|nr:hypothetical protein RHGRI_020954 [Rhododendron griersonianum]
MSRRLNLAAMVGRAWPCASFASPGSKPSVRPPSSSQTPASSSSPKGLLVDDRHKRPRRDAFGEEDDEDELSLQDLQARHASAAWTPTPPSDSVGSLETAIALAQGFLLPPDMVKEKELSLERLERTVVSHSIRSIPKIIEVYAWARQRDAETARLTAENAKLLAENNRLGEENFKLRDTTAQMGQQLEIEQGKRKDAEADFAKAMEELGKAEENVQIFEENMSEAFSYGFDDASQQFENQGQVLEGLDLTITETEVSDDETGPSNPVPSLLPSATPSHEVGFSSAAAAAVNTPAQTRLTLPPAAAALATPANPVVAIIDVDQEMIAPAA